MLAADKINLEKVAILVVAENSQSVSIMTSVLAGFGARNVQTCDSAGQAKAVFNKDRIDLLLTDGEMGVETGYDLVSWLRREGKEPNRYCSAIVVTGHTRLSRVEHARDCGAHFVVSKPLAPDVLLQRLFWVANSERLFIDADTYKGPDRRFKQQGPPAGCDGRRADDLPLEVGEAQEPNLTQEELDAIMKVGKVAL